MYQHLIYINQYWTILVYYIVCNLYCTIIIKSRCSIWFASNSLTLRQKKTGFSKWNENDIFLRKNSHGTAESEKLVVYIKLCGIKIRGMMRQGPLPERVWLWRKDMLHVLFHPPCAYQYYSKHVKHNWHNAMCAGRGFQCNWTECFSPCTRALLRTLQCILLLPAIKGVWAICAPRTREHFSS